MNKHVKIHLPKTPTKPKPFQEPLITTNHAAHAQYLNNYMDDHFILTDEDDEYALIPGFWRS